MPFLHFFLRSCSCPFILRGVLRLQGIAAPRGPAYPEFPIEGVPPPLCLEMHSDGSHFAFLDDLFLFSVILRAHCPAGRSKST